MQGTKHVAQRIVNGENKFVETVCEITGCTQAEALKALSVMRRLKVVSIDPVLGSFKVAHGIYMEADVLRNAIAFES